MWGGAIVLQDHVAPAHSPLLLCSNLEAGLHLLTNHTKGEEAEVGESASDSESSGQVGGNPVGRVGLTGAPVGVGEGIPVTTAARGAGLRGGRGGRPLVRGSGSLEERNKLG